MSTTRTLNHLRRGQLRRYVQRLALDADAAVDDAAGEAVGAVFRPQENAAGYLLVLPHVAQTRGIPLAIYSDRHGIFRRDPSARSPFEVAAHGPEPTQLGRAMRELGIQWIPAGKPQAKGRVERLFGAFQDRFEP
jgi:hypothetical protein